MKIISINEPRFKHNDEIYDVESRMFFSLTEFDDYLKRKKPNYVYIYKITNVDDMDNLIHPCDGLDKVKEDITILLICFKMFNT